MVDLILHHVSSQDLSGLRSLWQHLNQRVFSRMEPPHAAALARLEAQVLKLYVVHCVQNKKTDKAKEFFEKMAAELQGKDEWK